MKKTSILLPVLAAASLLAAASAQAQTFSFTVGYDFSGENGVDGTSYAATATDPSLTLGDATRGSGFGGLDPNNVYSGYFANGGVGLSLARANTFYATTTDAEADGEYLTFTLTVANDPTSFVSLGQLSFGAAIQNGGAYTGLAYSLDGGTTFTSVTGTQGGGNPAIGTYDLSGQTGLQDLLANSNVLFHLYDLTARGAGYEVGSFSTGNGSGLDVSIDGMTGPVPQAPLVPEPGTWAMLGVGAGLLGLTLRRRALRA